MKKITYTISLAVTISICFGSCQKPEGDDLSGTNEISGTIRIIDTLRGLSDSTAVANQVIRIAYPGESFRSNFIYSTPSKSNGFYTFTNLSKREYITFAEARVNNLDFFASTQVTAGSVKTADLILQPDTIKKNILVILTRDAQTRGVLNGARICLFSNELLASSNDCDGSFLTLTSDQYGRSFTTGLKPGRYYINAQLTSGSVSIKSKDFIDVLRNTGVFSSVVQLR
jgi:hypothetical protein